MEMLKVKVPWDVALAGRGACSCSARERDGEMDEVWDRAPLYWVMELHEPRPRSSSEAPSLLARLRRCVLATLGEAAWAPSIIFIAHVVASRVLNAYERYPPLDIPMHYLGGVVIGFFYHRASINASRNGILGAFHPVTHVALVCTTTVFWEFAEFISDRFFGGHAQLGVADTMGDMCMGILGGLSLLIALLARRTSISGAS